MTKEDFLTYLPKGTYGILATVMENGMPDARGWEFQFEEGGRYYFGTANTKAVYQQLKAHPKAVFVYMAPKGQYTARIQGVVHFITDTAEKAKAWEKIDPMVQKMYQSVENPAFEIFYLDACICRLAKGFNPPEQAGA